MLEFSRKEQYRARKDYKCDLCRETIQKGREYIYEVQKYDGFLQDIRRHIHCDAVLTAILDATGQDEYDADGIMADIDELVCDVCGYARDDECDKSPCFSCEIVQEALLTPTMLAAARQSVRENMEVEE